VQKRVTAKSAKPPRRNGRLRPHKGAIGRNTVKLGNHWGRREAKKSSPLHLGKSDPRDKTRKDGGSSSRMKCAKKQRRETEKKDTNLKKEDT